MHAPNIGKIVYSYDIITGVDAGKSVTAESRTTVYEYYDNGNKKSVQYQDGSRTDYTYYKDNLLNTLVSKKADGTVFESYSYNYDAAHNQTSKIDKKGTTNYTYDVLNRLETITEPLGRVSAYEFDASGNRSKQTVTENTTVTTTIYSYNEQNRLTGTAATGGTTENVTFTYDNNGNLLTEQKGTNTTTHTYDEFNQLRQTVKDSNTIKVKYNGEGKRVEREINGAVTRFLYEGNNIILEVNSSGVELARNIYGTNLVQRKVTGTILSYFYNGQGDVTALVNGAGAVAATYYYDAFGNHIEATGAADNPIRYRGYQYDGETGLYYLMSRMYCPVTARFLQEDSYRGDRWDPLSLNLYTYCHNEPIMYVDIDGHRATSNTYDPDAPDPKKVAPVKPSKPAPKPSQPKKPTTPTQPVKQSNDVGSSSSNEENQRRNMRATSASSDWENGDSSITNKAKNSSNSNTTKEGSNEIVSKSNINKFIEQYNSDNSHPDLTDVQVKALNKVNSYSDNKNIKSNEAKNPIIFAFEGAGNYSGYKDKYHPKGRYGAMMVVVKNGEILNVFRNTSTIPDNPDYRYSDGRYNPIVKEGVYTFESGLHPKSGDVKKQYPALHLLNTDGKSYSVPVTRNGKDDTSAGINIHRADKMDSNSSKWRDSEGCQVIRKDEYDLFAKTVGFAEMGKTKRGNRDYYNVKGVFVIDRSLR